MDRSAWNRRQGAIPKAIESPTAPLGVKNNPFGYQLMGISVEVDLETGR